MLKIKTATGKEFDSDFAVDNPQRGIAFVELLGQDIKTIRGIFQNADELPLDHFPQYNTLVDIFEDSNGVRLMLKHREEVKP